MKVFITRVIPEAGLQLIREAGIEHEQYEGKTPMSQEQFIAACQNADALLNAGMGKMDRQFLEACPHLKVISLLSAGYDHVDISAAKELGIPVGHTPDVLSDATADVAFLLMLAVSRKAFYMHKRIISGEWGFFEPTANLGVDLKGRTLGVFGLGSIGYEMAKRCRFAYDMKIIYNNRHTNPKAEQELGAVKVTFDELLAQSDVLTTHSTLTPETTGLFNDSTFARMKKTSIFINAGRGLMHNETDLISALQDGVIWGAGLDVTNPEPMKPDNPLLSMPNVAVLPHIGSATVGTRDAMAKMAAKNLIAGLKGEELPFEVKG